MSREIFTETEKNLSKLISEINKKLPSSKESTELTSKLITCFYQYGREKYREGTEDYEQLTKKIIKG